VHQIHGSAVPTSAHSLDAGQVDVIDQVFRDQFVDELDSTVVPDLVGDTPQQRLGLGSCHLDLS
jgi:hypothetical protein